MTENQKGHTPGPWELRGPTQVYGNLQRDQNSTGDRVAVTVTAADARLIAAAPDMVSALNWYADQLCEGWCEQSPDCAKFDDCAGCLARRVAFQATGEA
jgi:hypothetical protein